jgi:hypothetical protein
MLLLQQLQQPVAPLRSRAATALLLLRRRRQMCSMASGSSAGEQQPAGKKAADDRASIDSIYLHAHGESFDTFSFVHELEKAGLERSVAVAIMRNVQLACSKSLIAQTGLLATKEDLLALNQKLSESVFNATLKFDNSQRFSREIMQKDIVNLKSELKAADQMESSQRARDIAALEKDTLRRRESDEQRLAHLKDEIVGLEKRVIQYGLGGVVTFLTLGLGVARLLL